jgi:diguanylate cyclase (GGDEF)-like protein/PAS domain S-box-containing protein
MSAPQIWHGLLANLAILVVFVALATHTHSWRMRWPAPIRTVSLGILFGGGAIVLMLYPVEVTPGVYSDLRATIFALSGFFGGPIAGVVTAAIAAVFRLQLGGPGAVPAVVSMAVVTIVGIAGHLAVVRRRPIVRVDIVVLAGCAGVFSATGIFFLPAGVREQALTLVALPASVLVFASTVITGLAMRQEHERYESFTQNLIYRTIIESLPDSLNVKDRSGAFIVANPATAQLMGAPNAAALVGKTDFDFYERETAAAFREDEVAAMLRDGPVRMDQEFERADGTKVSLASLKVPVRGPDGTPFALITHNRDITERMKLAADLRATRERLNKALEQMADGLAMFDPDGNLVFCNQRYRDFFPRTADLRVPGASLRTILRASITRGEQIDIEPQFIDQWIEDTMKSLLESEEEEVHRYDGAWLHVRSTPMEDGNAMVVVSDITTIKRAETELLALTEQLKVLATIDPLTGLLNRRALDERLDREIVRSQRAMTAISVLLIDVDRFKAFNDLYGHPAGDTCLKRVATVLQSHARRPADIVARWGGEEFVLVLPEQDEDTAYRVAESCRQSVRDLGLEHSGSEKGAVTVSIGVASHAAADEDRSGLELVTRADEALYTAKTAGRDRVAGWREPPMITTGRAG